MYKLEIGYIKFIPYKKEKNKTKFAIIALKFDFKTYFGYNSRLLMRSVSFACMLDSVYKPLQEHYIKRSQVSDKLFLKEKIWKELGLS
ncbi:hypothetical protein [Campylobacter lanienae]|uniref:hypothetical protein n=1 Tax=Campylobacter lanienae TaxID=75658 RepID=UPI000BB44179|nr:hypothetical protein [Campylobacter lanienae]